jgi:hypothetical protein
MGNKKFNFLETLIERNGSVESNIEWFMSWGFDRSWNEQLPYLFKLMNNLAEYRERFLWMGTA